MAQTTINVRMDEETKKQIEKIFDEMGMSISTAFNIFAKAVIQKRQIPFIISADKSYYDEAYESYVGNALKVAENEENDSELYSIQEVMEEMKGIINEAKQKI